MMLSIIKNETIRMTVSELHLKNKMKQVSRLRLLLISFGCIVYSTLSYSQIANYPGGVVEFSIIKESTDLPEVKYGLQDVAVLDAKHSWRILLGIDLKTLPGEYLLYIKRQTDDSTAYNLKFEIAQQESSFINTSIDSQITAIYHDSFSDIEFNNSVEPELPLKHPAQGTWADYFGYININSDSNVVDARNYISLTTTNLIAVTAPQNAIISRVVENTPKDNTNNKKNYTLFLDHGRGLFSIISGITDITIEPGNGVKAGAILGKIYSDGNAGSEPNTLVWQTVLNGTYVNPSIFTKL